MNIKFIFIFILCIFCFGPLLPQVKTISREENLKVLLPALVLCLIGGLYITLFYDEPSDYAKKFNQKFNCGSDEMFTIDNGKKKKAIYLVENLVTGTPHLSCRMWDTYNRISKLALKRFMEKEDVTYQPVIYY